MKSHELAEYLLSLPDLPIYSHDGESITKVSYNEEEIFVEID